MASTSVFEISGFFVFSTFIIQLGYLVNEGTLPNKTCRAPELSRMRTGLEDRRSLVGSPARPIFFPRIDDSQCDSIHTSLTSVRCFNNGYVGKQPVAWKEYCAEHWLNELQESMGRCTSRRDLTEILLKTVLNTIQSNNQPNKTFCSRFFLL